MQWVTINYLYSHAAARFAYLNDNPVAHDAADPGASCNPDPTIYSKEHVRAAAFMVSNKPDH
jgi:hypothetical protein